MKRIRSGRYFGTAALCCALGLAMASSSDAQQPATEQSPQERLQTQNRLQGQRQAGEKQFCLATEVIGMNVKAKGDEDVGQIRNLIINADGQVQYLALSASSQQEARSPAAQILQPDRTDRADQKPAEGDRTATSGGQLTLVPWSLAKFHEGATSSQSYIAVAIEKDRLMSAPSFTHQQLTAAQGQMRVTAQVDQFFNVREQRGAARPELNSDKPDKPDQDAPRGVQPQRNDN